MVILYQFGDELVEDLQFIRRVNEIPLEVFLGRQFKVLLACEEERVVADQSQMHYHVKEGNLFTALGP